MPDTEQNAPLRLSISAAPELRLRVAADIIASATAHAVQITTAESCTGGLIMGALTDIPGSSAVIDRGFITYSNTAKARLLNVPAQTLRDHGAVSEPTVQAMATGAAQLANAQISIAVSGIAGPGGGSAEKPVGTVCFGFVLPDADANTLVRTQTCLFDGADRSIIRAQSVHYALQIVHDHLHSMAQE
ncbi:MAG: nicotinamide-nucleotide amidohydrolase family protein [Pseudomonadota bacterium]